MFSVSPLQPAQSQESVDIDVEQIDGFHPGGWEGGLHEGFSMTDEQMEKLVAMKSDLSEKIAPKVAALKAHREKLCLLLTASKVDKQAVLDVNEKINSLQSEISTARVGFLADASSLLTPDQREKMHHKALAGMLHPGGGMAGGHHMRFGGHFGGGFQHHMRPVHAGPGRGPAEGEKKE